MSQSVPSLLVVDDDSEIRALLRAAFESEGMLVHEAKNGADCAAIIESSPVDLVTLDLSLGGEDGLKIARELRARRNVPIVMITGKGEMIDRVVGLELGADDYITKPFHMREVIARVRAVLRRYSAEVKSDIDNGPRTGKGYEFEGWRLNILRREVTDPSGLICDLTTAEFNFLLLMLDRPGRVRSRVEIMDLLKGHDWNPIDRSIDALVARLRKKIEPHAERPTLIKTVRGVGYVFSGAVTKF